MTSLKLVILLGFTLMFVAGLTVGRSHKPTTTVKHESWLGRQLNLTPEQEQQMKQIWSPMAMQQGEIGKRFQEINHQRDERVKDLLTPEQKAQYEQIQKDAEAQAQALRAERGRIVHEAEERTRQILNEEQRKKYDEILKQHGRHRGGANNRRAQSPATMPNH